MDANKLFDAELRFMNLIWKHEPIKSTELVKVCAIKLSWKNQQPI